MDNPFKSPVILSICPGFLGLERGLDRALSRLQFGKATVAAYVEIEAFICANLVAGMEAGILAPAPIWTDVKTFDPHPFRGKILGYIGGYPCQPFSVAGKQKGTEDPRHLWPYIQRHIETIKPVWCFFENVRGHLTLGFDEVYRSLSEMGYAVECGIFTAEEVGAPHQRERLFILAIRKEYLAYAQHNGSNGATTLRGCLQAGNNNQKRQEEPVQLTEDSRRNGGAGLQGCELANAYGNGSGNPPRNCTTESGETEGTEQREERDEVQRQRLRPEFGISGERELDNSYCQRCGKERQLQDRSNIPSKLADSNNLNDNRSGDTRQGRRNESSNSCIELGNTDNQGLQGRLSAISCECTGEWITGQAGTWPACPGQQQHEWEEPRTVKPGMGCTINGYNFREDLLRAYGNSVVEQTAELAFKTLLQKHFA